MTKKKENLSYFFHRKSWRVKPTPERIVIRLVTLDNLLPSLQQSLKHSRMTTVIAYSIKIESLRQRNADALKNAMVEEGLGQICGVRGCPRRENQVKNLLLRSELFSFSFLDTEMAFLKTSREALFIGHEAALSPMQNSYLFIKKTLPKIQISLTTTIRGSSEADGKANFRLEKHHVGRLVDALQIPAIFKCDQGTICEGLEGLCILIKSFAFPVGSLT